MTAIDFTIFEERPYVPLAPDAVVEPVQLEIVRACQFKAKGCGRCGLPKANKVHHKPEKGGTCEFQRKLGCANCGGNKGAVEHYGAPKSFNVVASGQGSGNAMIYANMKKTWQELLTQKLVESRLPRGLGRVFAEGEITFPDQREDRDQGNFRIVIEKALGDALERGGWLPRDDWTHYEFGGLTQRYQKGESATRIVLFPAPPPRTAQEGLPL